jgi:hypothetical protein
LLEVFLHVKLPTLLIDLTLSRREFNPKLSWGFLDLRCLGLLVFCGARMNLSTNDADRGAEFSDDDYDKAYPPDYELHYWHRARGSIVSGLVCSVCKKGDTVLEIGAGRGHYVRLLRAGGFDAYGCDLGSPKVHEDVSSFVFSRAGFADLAFSLRQAGNRHSFAGRY